MSKDEYIQRYAIAICAAAGGSGGFGHAIAEIAAENTDDYTDPEGDAAEEMSYWTD